MQKIAIHSVPRSGSTWLGEILNSSPNVKYCFQPLFSYKFKDYLDEHSSKKDINKFFSMLKNTDDEFICQKMQRAAGTLPNFEEPSFVTHIIYKEVRYHHILENLLCEDDEIKLILLVRNPIEVMNSWMNAPKEFDKTWDPEKELVNAQLKNQGRKENFYGLNAWVQTTLLFEKLARKYQNRVFLLRYASLKNDAIPTVAKLFEFCDLKLNEDTHNFLKKSLDQNITDTYSVFRGGKRSQIVLDPKVINKIVTYIHDNKLSQYIE